MSNQIKALRKTRCLSAQALADATGTSRQQIYRLESGKRRLTDDWLRRLGNVLGCSPMDIMGDADAGFAEAEVAYIHEEALQDVEMRLAHLLYPAGHADTMVVNSPSLILEGFIPGDRLLVDLRLDPKENDVVIAQVYDDQADSAETVLRLYRPPFLVPFSHDRRYQPFALADDHVTVKAVVVGRYSRPADLDGERAA